MLPAKLLTYGLLRVFTPPPKKVFTPVTGVHAVLQKGQKRVPVF